MGEERLFVGVTKAGENQGKSMRIDKSMPIQITENQDTKRPNSSRPKNGSD